MKLKAAIERIPGGLMLVAVMLAARWQRARGIDGTAEETRS